MIHFKSFIHQKINYAAGILILGCIFVLINSCHVKVTPGFIEDDKKNTEKEIEQFHTKLNAEDYEGIYHSSSLLLQKSMSKTQRKQHCRLVVEVLPILSFLFFVERCHKSANC
jgi:hypothetical protein